MARDPADTIAGDEDYVAPTGQEACAILEQKLKESILSDWNSPIRAAITMYTGSFAIAKREGKEDDKIIDAMGQMMVAMAVGLLHRDRDLRIRAKGMRELVDKYFELFKSPFVSSD